MLKLGVKPAKGRDFCKKSSSQLKEEPRLTNEMAPRQRTRVSIEKVPCPKEKTRVIDLKKEKLGKWRKYQNLKIETHRT